MKIFLLCGILLSTICLPSALADLATQADQLRKEYGLTSLVVGIWEADTPLLHQAFGDSMTDVPADLGMKFRAGGACLTALSCLLLQANEAGKVSLDDTIQKWKPGLPGADKVTLRMLANCTSGYGDYVASAAFADAFHANPFRSFTSAELISFGVGTRLLYPPGTDWNYSHTNFVILGEILAQIYNQPVQQLLEEQIFKPLHLQNTLFTPNAALPEPVLHAFSTERGIFEDSTFWNPSWTSYSGSIASTVDDLRTLFRAIGQARLISPKSLKEMTASTTVGMGGNRADRFYGMGIGVMKGWLFQNPNFGGYQGVIAYHPATDRLIVLFVTLGKHTDPDVHYAMRLYEQLLPEAFPETAP